MDPVSIVMITNASFAIARSLVHTIKELYELAEAYETAALGIRTVATQCNSFRIAIERINKWLPANGESNRHNLDDDFWQALKSNIDTGALVVDDLNRRIQGFKKSPSRFRTRTKYIWNSVVISELQSQIQGLMSAVSLLITVIDLPSTGAKCSMSRAQSTRLNGLTQAARKRVDEQRYQAIQSSEQASHDEGGLDMVDDGSAVAPPPYVRSPEESVDHISHSSHTTLQSAALAQQTEVGANIPESAETVKDDAGKPPKKKSSRPSWMKFTKRPSNKQEEQPAVIEEILTSHAGGVISPPESLSALTSRGDHDRTDVTSTSTNSPDANPDYFKLRSTRSETTPSEHTTIGRESLQSSPTSSTQEGLIRTNDGASSSRSTNNNPYLALRLARTESETGDPSNPKQYNSLAKVSSNDFDSIRPSQRVKVQREQVARQNSADTNLPSPGGATTPTSGTATSSVSRLGSLSLVSTNEGSQQSWQTTTLANRTIKFKIQFEKELFTNKMSASAARALGVDDSIFVYDHVPTTQLTLLHVIMDGAREEDTVVNGEEIEFEVMDEYQSRIPQLVLGAGLFHLAHIMQEGRYIYWSPRAVPGNLRAVEKLRLYRRFELTMW